MIEHIRQMIARCRDRMRAGACATCDNRATCPAGRWQQAFPPASNGRRASGFFTALVEIASKLSATSAPQGFRGKVEAVLAPLLESGHASADRVARELGVSRQTLYRRLKAEGTTFEDILDAVRRKLAMRYLGRERISVKAAAYKLGFSEPAAFSRAFKRWTGRNPSTFRDAPAA